MTTLKDIIGAMVAWAQRRGLLPEPSSNANARHHRRAAAPEQVYVNRLTARLVRERLELAAARTTQSYRVTRAAALQRNPLRRMPARARFAPVAAAGRTASREAVSIAASTARRTGAGIHRHLGSTTADGHAIAARLLEHKRRVLASLGRAPGEMTTWDRLRHA